MSMRISSTQISHRIATDMARQQAAIATVQEQISSGKRVNSPSDDPAQAGRLRGMQEASARLDQYDRNASAAEARLSLQETSLIGVTEALVRVRDLALSVTNGAVDDAARTAIQAEVEHRLHELYELANVTDSNGDYLFAGNNSSSRPFAMQSPAGYAGDDATRSLPIGLGREVSTGDAGSDVFLRVKEGNGRFAVDATASNTGTGVIAVGNMNSSAASVLSNYRIEFTTANSFDIINTDSGATIQGGVSYTEDAPIAFDGVTTSLRGKPEAGDSFGVRPSGFKDLFSSVADLSTTLLAAANTPAEKTLQKQSIDKVLSNIDQSLDHVNTIRSRIGSRLTSIDSSRDENSAVQLQLDTTRASIEDLDVAEAVTELQARISSLEILQKSFVRIENLSLFDYM